MKGLLCKDWAILVNSYKKNFLIMVVLYLGMAVCLHMDYLCYGAGCRVRRLRIQHHEF